MFRIKLGIGYFLGLTMAKYFLLLCFLVSQFGLVHIFPGSCEISTEIQVLIDI